jgi:hypothetical protein
MYEGLCAPSRNIGNTPKFAFFSWEPRASQSSYRKLLFNRDDLEAAESAFSSGCPSAWEKARPHPDNPDANLASPEFQPGRILADALRHPHPSSSNHSTAGISRTPAGRSSRRWGGIQFHQVELFGAAGLAQAFQRAQLPRTGGGIHQARGPRNPPPPVPG